MIEATDRTYKLTCYCSNNDPHYYFSFRRTSSWNRWELTLLDNSKVPKNEELAYFVADLFDRTWDYLPNERILDITILSVDKKTSVCIDTCDAHPCSGEGQFKTTQQNVLEILLSQNFKLC